MTLAPHEKASFTGIGAAALLCGLALLASACDDWPLYAHIGEDLLSGDDLVGEPELVEFEEEALQNADSDPTDELVPVPATQVPSITQVHGELGACGYDDASAWPIWPRHPVDSDGDGVADGSTASHQGWYSAEVDVFQIAASTDADLFVVLEWDNSPEGGSNAPMLPGDATAPWASESDLDFVVLDVEDGELGVVLRDVGVSLAYPQQLWTARRMLAGESLALAVGCHHGLPTGYSLAIELRSP